MQLQKLVRSNTAAAAVCPPLQASSSSSSGPLRRPPIGRVLHRRMPQLMPSMTRVARPPGGPTAPCGQGASSRRPRSRASVDPRKQLPRDSPSAAEQGSERASSCKEEPQHATDDFFGTEELAGELQDRTSLGKRGEPWLLAQLVCASLLLAPPVRLRGIVAFCGSLSLSSGVAFIAYALLSIGRNFSPLPVPRKQHTLVVTGAYAHVRHPMYGGALMLALGLAAVTRSEVRLVVTVLLWFLVERLVRVEERLLKERYGDEYAEFLGRTKKLVPMVY